MEKLVLLYVGRDSFSRPVFEAEGKLYVDVDPCEGWAPKICTKYGNNFDGEPDVAIREDVAMEFIPGRDLWDKGKSIRERQMPDTGETLPDDSVLEKKRHVMKVTLYQVIPERDNERLLSAALGHGWDWSRMDRDFLWLIRIPGREEKEPGQSLWIQGKEIFLKDLASRDKLFAHLREYGANVSELADFCDGCQTSYDELLYWDYPLCDDRNRRFFLVLDREGIVKLPYDSNDFHDEAVFLLDDASFVSAEEMERFCEVWDSRLLKLRQVMYAMECFLRRQEEKSNEEAKD